MVGSTYQVNGAVVILACHKGKDEYNQKYSMKKCVRFISRIFELLLQIYDFFEFVRSMG